MSKVIKSSQITGEYKLSDRKAIEKKKSNAEKLLREAESKNKELINEKKKIIVEAEERAAEIVEEAQEEAARILDKAKNEKQKIHEEAKEKAKEDGYEQGFAEGKTEGYKLIQEEGREQLATLANTLETIEIEVEKEVDRLPESFVYLAIDIAGEIVKTQLDINPSLIIPVVKDCLTQVGLRHNQVIVRVNPVLIGLIADLDNEYKGKFNIEVIGDDNLEKGDCLVETKFGGKDGTIENKLKLLRKELLKEVSANEEN